MLCAIFAVPREYSIFTNNGHGYDDLLARVALRLAESALLILGICKCMKHFRTHGRLAEALLCDADTACQLSSSSCRTDIHLFQLLPVSLPRIRVMQSMSVDFILGSRSPLEWGDGLQLELSRLRRHMPF